MTPPVLLSSICIETGTVLFELACVLKVFMAKGVNFKNLYCALCYVCGNIDKN